MGNYKVNNYENNSRVSQYLLQHVITKSVSEVTLTNQATVKLECPSHVYFLISSFDFLVDSKTKELSSKGKEKDKNNS